MNYLDAGKSLCPVCEFSVGYDWNFCPWCGETLPHEEDDDKYPNHFIRRKKNWLIIKNYGAYRVGLIRAFIKNYEEGKRIKLIFDNGEFVNIESEDPEYVFEQLTLIL